MKIFNVHMSAQFILSKLLLVGLACALQLASTTTLANETFEMGVRFLIKDGVKRGYIDHEPSSEQIALFVNTLTRDFTYAERNEIVDDNMQERPVYFLSAIELLGLKSIKASVDNSASNGLLKVENNYLIYFFNSLIELLKTQDLKSLKNFSLKSFGILNMQTLLSRTVELDLVSNSAVVSAPHNFEVHFKTDCNAKKCEVGTAEVDVVPHFAKMTAIALTPETVMTLHRGNAAILNGLGEAFKNSEIKTDFLSKNQNLFLNPTHAYDNAGGGVGVVPHAVYLSMAGISVKVRALGVKTFEIKIHSVFILPKTLNDPTDTEVLTQLNAHIPGLAWGDIILPTYLP